MLGAIYIGLSGMEAYSKGLQAISNNVANLDTLGYKATIVNFADIFNADGGGLTFQDNTGQLGSGVRFGQPEIDFSQGTLTSTNSGLDLAIQGDGFLVLQNNGQTYYTRTGSFVVDQDGFISQQGTTNHLAVLNAAGQAVPLNVNSQKTNPPKATTNVTFTQNLSSGQSTDTISNVTVFDSTGASHNWKVTLTADTTTPNQWNVVVTDESGTTISTSTLDFANGAADPATAKTTVTTSPAGADPLSVTLDFSSATSFSGGDTSTLAASSIDGNAAGSLTAVTITTDGQVQLAYSNNKTVLDGFVAMATFSDPQQLERVGNGLFQNSGRSQVALRASGNPGVGTLVSKQLETANVDLSQEFGDLILIQRGFQASSQVVSVSNDMIQDLFGIRGHG
jgi:flagellar hook protein FlgE